MRICSLSTFAEIASSSLDMDWMWSKGVRLLGAARMVLSGRDLRFLMRETDFRTTNAGKRRITEALELVAIWF